jgi:hypothetical protein
MPKARESSLLEAFDADLQQRLSLAGQGQPEPREDSPDAAHTKRAALPREVVPDHELLRCIGRGSYGEVWLARSTIGLFRAVKVIHRSTFVDQAPFEREVRGICKFEPVSRSCDSFLDILQVGQNEAEGCFYYVMELGDDLERGQAIDPQTYSPKTLSKVIETRGRLPVSECLSIGLSLCEGLAHLHESGLLHRDVKPSNIIFAGGVPKLADIGLVTAVGEAASYVGTEGYIPPEGPVSVQADLYSLGKVLYEASTGMGRDQFPQLPTNLGEGPDVALFLELNGIILKACETDRQKRYRSAEDMRADLLLLKAGGSVQRLTELERRLSRLKRAMGIILLAIGALTPVYLLVFLLQREPGYVIVFRPFGEHPNVGWLSLGVGVVAFLAGLLTRTRYELRWTAHKRPSPVEFAVGTIEKQQPRRWMDILLRRRKVQLESTEGEADDSLKTQQREFGTVTLLAGKTAPTNFFESRVFPPSRLIAGKCMSFEPLEVVLQTYLVQLRQDYRILSLQAATMYRLWVACMIICVLAAIAAFTAMLLGHVAAGTGGSIVLVPLFLVLRLLAKREDHYRSSANEKSGHVSYAGLWLSAMKRIQSIQDSVLRNQRRERAVNVFTQKLESRRAMESRQN